MSLHCLTAELATKQNLEGYGTIIEPEESTEAVKNPYFAEGSLVEATRLKFQCEGLPVIRTLKLLKKEPIISVKWLERHMKVTQIFQGLGKDWYVLVLGKPTHEEHKKEQRQQPNMSNVKAFLFPPGHGVMLDIGTWHDAAIPVNEEITVLTVNSSEVVTRAMQVKEAIEFNEGDIEKVSMEKRFGCRIAVEVPSAP